MADYAYLNGIKIEARNCTAVDKGSRGTKIEYDCECGAKLHLCGGGKKAYYFALAKANGKHNLINGEKCLFDECGKVSTGRTKYRFKSMSEHEDKNPTKKNIDNIQKLIDIEKAPIINTPPISPGPVNKGTEPPIEIIVPFGEDDDDDENGNLDMPPVEIGNEEKISDSLLKLYNDVKSGDRNTLIDVFRDGTRTAFDLVVNEKTLTTYREIGIPTDRLMLIHAYKASKPNGFDYSDEYFFLKDDDTKSKERIYFEVGIKNPEWHALYNKLIKTKFETKALHVYMLVQLEDVSRNGLKVYRTKTNTKCFRITLKNRFEDNRKKSH